ncbi:MAG TPA: branched-chain amino acid ABC transporter permease [Candidatus Dormibacteraeota bacterium]|jgi:branched-chain amino acid transport system permease protein|nr:branched-chain amino acid ABC transporter permease [Candidatus Dormibacteraeota bacterium]
MRFFVEQLTFGLTDGAIFALVALGYTMVYGIIELINFAHGDVFTVGGFLGLAAIGLLGLEHASPVLIIPGVILVFAVAMLLNGLLGVTIERVAYRPLRNAPRLAPLITAVGMSFILEGILFLIKGPNQVSFPNLLPSGSIGIGSISVGTSSLLIIVIALALMVALNQFIQRTRIGRAMRATAQDRDAARLMGININRTIAITFFIGSALAAAGGIVYGFYYQTISFDLGFRNGLIAFTAAVFGGIGNVVGAAIGGFIIGVIIALISGYFQGGAQWSDVVVFSILILTLVFRPTGLLGMRVPEK